MPTPEPDKTPVIRWANWLDLEPEIGSTQLEPHGLEKEDESFSEGNSGISPEKEGIYVGRKKEKERKRDYHTIVFGKKSMYLGDSISLMSYWFFLSGLEVILLMILTTKGCVCSFLRFLSHSLSPHSLRNAHPPIVVDLIICKEQQRPMRKKQGDAWVA